MSKVNLDEERNAIDYVTQIMYSTAFLHDISNLIFSSQPDRISVGEFYGEWLKQSEAPEVKIPFSPGAVLGYLMVGILWTKEHWLESVPDVDYKTADSEWGLTTCQTTSPKRPNPTLRYVVRRIRNSLGHGRAILHVPDDVTKDTLLQKATLTFKDSDPRDPSDNFELTATLDELSRFVKKFQITVHADIKKRMDEARVPLPPRLGVEKT
jgi:HEPN family protein